MADIIVTGLPRSGSAAVAALMDFLPDTVCLNTPPWQAAFAKNPVDALPFCKWMVGDFLWARRLLLDGVPLRDFRAADGAPLMDGLHDARSLRSGDGEAASVQFTRGGLTPGFTLAMRQTTLFTSVLPTIASFRHFRIIAVIRHPLDVCQSWMRMAQPLLAQGKPPGIVRFWSQAIDALEGGGSQSDRFARLYELHIQRYHELGEQVEIVKYEDVMRDPLAVSRLLGKDVLSAAAAQLLPRTATLDAAMNSELRESFRKYGVFSQLYYPMDA